MPQSHKLRPWVGKEAGTGWPGRVLGLGWRGGALAALLFAVARPTAAAHSVPEPAPVSQDEGPAADSDPADQLALAKKRRKPKRGRAAKKPLPTHEDELDKLEPIAAPLPGGKPAPAQDTPDDFAPGDKLPGRKPSDKPASGDKLPPADEAPTASPAAGKAAVAPAAAAVADPAGPPRPRGPGRGFPDSAPWVSFYGPAKAIMPLERVARTFRIINIDADPGVGAFTAAQIQVLKAGGRNRVISYMNVGACETFREYFKTAPRGFVSCKDNLRAQRGRYAGYPNEIWMDPSHPDYQALIVDHVALRLAKTGVDGFYLDNLEILEHDELTDNGPCGPQCRQGGLDLVARLRKAFPDHLIVMQNATSDVTRLGRTELGPYPELLDGIAHEQVFAPAHDNLALGELQAWKALKLTAAGRPFFIGVEDYVGDCTQIAKAKKAYAANRAHGFSPYASDSSAGQQKICFWGF